MGLKLLHTADWHLDSPFGGFSEEQRQSLRRIQRQIPGKIAALARREHCDLLLIAGDVFDGTPTRETLDCLKRALEEAAMPVFIAPGNHDFVAPGSPWLEEIWPENVYIFTSSLESIAIPKLNLRVYGAGYDSMDCPGLLEGFHVRGEEAHQVMVLHGDPTQKTSPYCPITAPQVRSSGLSYLALGHIHKAGTFHAGDTVCAWPGCPMGRGWDETGDKGVCLVTLEQTAQVQAVSLDLPRFFDRTIDTEGNPSAALEATLPPVGTQDFYRVTLTGDGPADLPALYSRFSHLPNLTLRDETQAPVDPWADAGEDTLEGVYFHILRQLMAENSDQADTIRLAAEISRKLLSGREVLLP